MAFRADVSVRRLVDIIGDEESVRFIANVGVVCADCGEPFAFTGLACGSSSAMPTVDIPSTTARLPICSVSELAARNAPARIASP